MYVCFSLLRYVFGLFFGSLYFVSRVFLCFVFFVSVLCILFSFRFCFRFCFLFLFLFCFAVRLVRADYGGKNAVLV
jgi:hypothetical protein